MNDLYAIRARSDQEHPRNLSAYREGSAEWHWLRAAMDRRDLLAEVDRLTGELDQAKDVIRHYRDDAVDAWAAVARVEALADNWEAIPYDKRTPYDEGWHDALDICGTELRAALDGDPC